jgi:predicted nucleotidyltransferase
VTIREFPALGFDPTPGDARAVKAAARQMDRAARTFVDASRGVGRLNSSGWTGEAAEAFRGELKDLPRDLEFAARSHRAAARTLSKYGFDLETRQRRADELESRAEELKRQQAQAVAEVNRIAAHTAPGDSAELATLRSHHTAAKSRVDGLNGDLAQVVADARRLLDEHRSAARSAAMTIRNASEAPYRRPGWLSRALTAAKSWITDHADVLTKISTVLKSVSAVLGVLSLVPGFQFLAPFAIAAGGIALALDVAVKAVTGRGSWKTLGLDAALTVVPLGPVARAIKAVPGVTPAFKAANSAVPDTVKGPLFRAVGNLPEGITRAQLDAAAAQIRSRAGHYGDDVIVQGSRAGYSARPDSDIDLGIRVSPEDFREIVWKCFATPNPGSSKEKTLAKCLERGRVHARRAGLVELRNDLDRMFARKADVAIIERGGLFDAEPWLSI